MKFKAGDRVYDMNGKVGTVIDYPERYRYTIGQDIPIRYDYYIKEYANEEDCHSLPEEQLNHFTKLHRVLY